MRFPSNIHKELKNYIYAYYDPTDGNDLPFYIGRGIGNRAFSHLKDSHNPEVQKILDKLNDLFQLALFQQSKSSGVLKLRARSF